MIIEFEKYLRDAKRPPVKYTVDITQWYDGAMNIQVHDVSNDERSRQAVAQALRDAAEVIDQHKNGD